MARHHIRTMALTGAAWLCVGLQPAHASKQGWDDASTIARDALAVVAVAVPLVEQDWNGALQAGGSMAAAKVITFGLKEAFPETRPDGSDRNSFPSGHTSLSFAAAATLTERQGWEVGAPAHIVAAFVGFARVKADKHHWYDVLAGAAIGEATGLLITRKPQSDLAFVPWGDSKGGGISFAMRF